MDGASGVLAPWLTSIDDPSLDRLSVRRRRDRGCCRHSQRMALCLVLLTLGIANARTGQPCPSDTRSRHREPDDDAASESKV